MTNKLEKKTGRDYKQEYLKKLKIVNDKDPGNYFVEQEIFALENPGMEKAFTTMLLGFIIGAPLAYKYGPQICEAINNYIIK